MQTIGKAIWTAGMVCAVFAANLLLAPRLAAQAESTDSIIQLTADANGLQLVSPEEPPLFASVYWGIGPGDFSAAPFPCLPPGDNPIYALDANAGVYLVDLTAGQTNITEMMLEAQASTVVGLITQVQAAQTADVSPQLSGRAHPMDGGISFPGGGGGTNSYGDDLGTNSFSVDYGTNLWLQITGITNIWVNLIISNTISGVEYEIESLSDLKQTNWEYEGIVFGSESTNWTPDTIAAFSPATNLFLRVQPWADDGSGLPVWWQIQYFGYVGVDPYGDPTGDGWNNLQSYQNGWNPTQFRTPPAPQNFTASYNLNSSTETMTWLPSPGNVTSYTLTVTNEQTGLVTSHTLSATNTSFTTSLAAGSPDFAIPPYGPQINEVYGLQANYGTNGSSPSASQLAEGDIAPSAQLANGADGRLSYIFQGLPGDLSAVRIYRQQDEVSYALDYNNVDGPYAEDDLLQGIVNSPIDDGYFEIPAANITNGMCELSDSQAPPFFAYNFWVQTVRSNGVNSAWTTSMPALYYNFYSASKPFVDARRQLKDNLIFLLRAAPPDGPFGFQVSEGYVEDWYLPPLFTWPANYVYADIYTFNGDDDVVDELRPVQDNYFYRNFAFNTENLASDGFLNTGCYETDPATITNYPTYYFDAASFVTGTNLALPSSQLTSALTQWILPVGWDVGTFAGGTYSGAFSNFYGLANVSAENAWVTNGQVVVGTFHQGDTLPNGVSGMQYFEMAQPEFVPAGYYFARPNMDPLPEQSRFSPTETQPTLFAGVGNSLAVAGYSKLAVTNGFPGVYAWLGQYFAGAYQINSNGVVTANSAGLLSPYGVFSPIVPGPAALVTMPDIDTGEQGTCLVHSVSMQFDANHDGTMDLSATGADATSPSHPMKLWVNNSHTVPGFAGDLDEDVDDAGRISPNYIYQKVTCPRDLENFFRLWICGLPAMGANYQVSLAWNVTTGNPVINLYSSVETNGGIGYLTDTNIAAQQSATSAQIGQVWPYNVAYSGAGAALTQITPEQSFIFPSNFFTNSANRYFLFEGAGIGSGQLVLTVATTNGYPLAQTSAYLDLHDVKDFYEQAYATNVTSGNPPSDLASDFRVIKTASPAPNETRQTIVFVHGINNTDFDFEDGCQTIYKRLYWSGYNGRFAGFRWPCAYLVPNVVNPLEFNLGEFYAWKSATALKDYLSYLRNRPDLAGYDLDIFAHSQGNIVASEALEQGATFDNYILTQGAVPAHCYDTNAPFLPSLVAADSAKPTPLYAVNGGYHGYFSGLHGNLINFYNTNDFALASGITYILGIPVISNWVQDQRTQKPESFVSGPSYTYNPTNTTSFAYYPTDIGNYIVTDMQESKALVARSRSSAVGAQGGLGGVIKSSVDLLASFNFGSTRDEHSAQFKRPIQATLGYYQAVLAQLQPAQ